jgi:hypothetical protein
LLSLKLLILNYSKKFTILISANCPMNIYKNMNVQKISAVTLKVKNMRNEWQFYSKIPGLSLSYGGPISSFTSFEIKDDDSNSKSYINLEYTKGLKRDTNFGRIIIYSRNVDTLYDYFKHDQDIRRLITIKNKPVNGIWGERYFHILDPEEYELSFAQLIS